MSLIRRTLRCTLWRTLSPTLRLALGLDFLRTPCWSDRGFSALGLAIGLAVLAPNLLLVLFPPRTQLPTAHVPRLLGWIERAGQALCLVVPAITQPGTLVGWWAIPVCAGVAGYYVLWLRYLLTGCEGATLYRSWWVMPVPMAILPVAVFLGAAGWLSNPWIAIAAVVLAAGHILASVIIARSVRTRR